MTSTSGTGRTRTATQTKNYYRILDDPKARTAADAIAFHPYWGDPTVMRDAYETYGKPVHLTETSDLSPATILSDFRLDASSYVFWAQTTDQNGGTLHWTPLRDNNVDWDQVAATTHWTDRLVTVNTDTKTYSVRDELYPIGQFAKYLNPSDVRVESSATSGGISNVVYTDPHDNWTAVLGNANATDATVRMVLAGKTFTVTVPAGSYATYRWHQHVAAAHRNHAPVFAPVAPVTADQYATTTFTLAATDRDRDKLAYYAVDLPDGVTVDATSGAVTVHPTKAGAADADVLRHRRQVPRGGDRAADRGAARRPGGREGRGGGVRGAARLDRGRRQLRGEQRGGQRRRRCRLDRGRQLAQVPRRRGSGRDVRPGSAGGQRDRRGGGRRDQRARRELTRSWPPSRRRTPAAGATGSPCTYRLL